MGIFGRLKRFIYSATTTTLPRSEGERLVERRVSILGKTVSVRREQRSHWRVALLIDEYFGGWNTAIGGYGALARNYVCRFIPNSEIKIDVLMNTYGGITRAWKKTIDSIDIYQLPRLAQARQDWLDQQGYDLFISIEMTEASFRIIGNYESVTPLLFWIQDPRDLKLYQSRLETVQILRDGDWGYTTAVANWIGKAIRQGRITFCSQGLSLTSIARASYGIPETVEVVDLPNPVSVDPDFFLGQIQKRKKIIFLGRLEAQKRAWIFCQIAAAMPQYEFYVLGATGRGRNRKGNTKALAPYRNADGSSKIANLHFCGHVDGVEKRAHIQSAKLLVNTSIWEGIPVSWLEALSYGTLIVSSFDRDDIVKRFGTFVGEVMGDGIDANAIGKYTAAIEYWMENDARRTAIAENAIAFISERHSVDRFAQSMRKLMLQTIT